MTIKQYDNYQQIAQSLLGRPLSSQDGVKQDIITQTEQRLGHALPEPLVNFYLTIGQLPQFMSAFQLVALPEQLYQEDDLLIFLEENEGACYWGVDEQGKVYQCEESNRYDLQLTLTDFLVLILFYQVAQGAEYVYCTNLLDQELALLYQEDGWQQVINQDDLVIYQRDTQLIWFFKDENNEVVDDMVYFVSLLEIPEQVITQYVLEEL